MKSLYDVFMAIRADEGNMLSTRFCVPAILSYLTWGFFVVQVIT